MENAYIIFEPEIIYFYNRRKRGHADGNACSLRIPPAVSPQVLLAARSKEKLLYSQATTHDKRAN